jgi:hypothetical protein
MWVITRQYRVLQTCRGFAFQLILQNVTLRMEVQQTAVSLPYKRCIRSFICKTTYSGELCFTLKCEISMFTTIIYLMLLKYITNANKQLLIIQKRKKLYMFLYYHRRFQTFPDVQWYISHVSGRWRDESSRCRLHCRRRVENSYCLHLQGEMTIQWRVPIHS